MGVPIYMRVQQYILAKIDAGEWAPGTMVPTEAELSRQFGCSRITITNALRELVKDGRIYRIQGKGSFVSERVGQESVYVQSGLYRYGVTLDDVSIPGEHRTWSVRLEKPSEEIAAILRLEAEQDVIVINKIKYVDGKLFAAERLYLPGTLFSQVLTEHLEELHFSEIASRCDVIPGKSFISSTPVLCDAEISQMLNVPAGSPILQFCIEIHDMQETPVAIDLVYVEGKQSPRQL